ncbi:TIGR03621 family F420-dependent LLM class oxidoreductase [Nonomuraea sp. NPDC050547]|uniref:TIGR03621 family F420-dependent LLM class oxidoreductase n=1 Tax=unclassified Nonomuraea TaxID=2593643 RepID=UPI0037957211
MIEARFRFGVQVGRAWNAAEWSDTVKKAEDLGYSSLLMPDHADRQWGVFTALGAASAITRELKLGTLMLNCCLRNPVTVSKELATLDLMSDGRVECGLGAGWMFKDFERTGVMLETGAVRIRRLAEYVHILRSLWSAGDEPVTFSGEFYHFKGAKPEPRPRTAQPLLMMGGGGRQMLSLAADMADIIGVSATMFSGAVGPETGPSSSFERFLDRRRLLVDRLTMQGLARKQIQCQTFLATVTKERNEVLDSVAAPMLGLSPSEAGRSPLVLVGEVEDICDQIRRHGAELGISYWVVHSGALETFAPVVRQLSGEPLEPLVEMGG